PPAEGSRTRAGRRRAARPASRPARRASGSADRPGWSYGGSSSYLFLFLVCSQLAFCPAKGVFLVISRERLREGVVKARARLRRRGGLRAPDSYAAHEQAVAGDENALIIRPRRRVCVSCRAHAPDLLLSGGRPRPHSGARRAVPDLEPRSRGGAAAPVRL